MTDVAEAILHMEADAAHEAVFDALVPARLLSRAWFTGVAYPQGELTRIGASLACIPPSVFIGRSG